MCRQAGYWAQSGPREEEEAGPKKNCCGRQLLSVVIYIAFIDGETLQGRQRNFPVRPLDLRGSKALLDPPQNTTHRLDLGGLLHVTVGCFFSCVTRTMLCLHNCIAHARDCTPPYEVHALPAISHIPSTLTLQASVAEAAGEEDVKVEFRENEYI